MSLKYMPPFVAKSKQGPCIAECETLISECKKASTLRAWRSWGNYMQLTGFGEKGTWKRWNFSAIWKRKNAIICALWGI